MTSVMMSGGGEAGRVDPRGGLLMLVSVSPGVGPDVIMRGGTHYRTVTRNSTVPPAFTHLYTRSLATAHLHSLLSSLTHLDSPRITLTLHDPPSPPTARCDQPSPPTTTHRHPPTPPITQLAQGAMTTVLPTTHNLGQQGQAPCTGHVSCIPTNPLILKCISGIPTQPSRYTF